MCSYQFSNHFVLWKENARPLADNLLRSMLFEMYPNPDILGFISSFSFFYIFIWSFMLNCTEKKTAYSVINCINETCLLSGLSQLFKLTAVLQFIHIFRIDVHFLLVCNYNQNIVPLYFNLFLIKGFGQCSVPMMLLWLEAQHFSIRF